MASTIPLRIRLQRMRRDLLERLNPERYILKIVDWLDKRRALKVASRKGRELQNGVAGAAAIHPGGLRSAVAWIRRHWLLCGLFCLLSLGVPAVPRIRQWRCDRLILSAEKSLVQCDWKQALDTARSTPLIRQGDRRAHWVVFRSLRETNAPLAVDCALRLCAQRDLSGDEAYELLQFLSGDHPQGAFLAAFATLTMTQQEVPLLGALYAQLLIRRGKLAAAGRMLDSTPDPLPEPALTLQRVRLYCALGTPQDIRKARTQFLALRTAGAPEALSALRLLSAVPEGVRLAPEDGFPALSEWLESLPEATVSDRLISFDQRCIEGEPSENLSAEVTGRFGEKHLPQVCAWLNRQGLRSDVILLLTGREKQGAAGFAALVEAQHALGLPAAQTNLDSPPSFADPVDLALLRARAGVSGWARTAEVTAWRRALDAASSDHQGNRTRDLSRLPHAAGRYAEMQDVLAVAWQRPGGDLPIFADASSVLDALARRDKLAEVIRILWNLRRFESSNPLLNARLLYFQCLAGQVSATGALPVLTSLHKESPGNICAGMLAFVRLLDGQTTAAAELLDSLDAPNSREAPLVTAMHGTVLKLCGRMEEAEALLSKVDWGSATILPAEERRLLSLLKTPRT